MPPGLDDLKKIVGSSHVVTDPDVLAGRSVDYTGRYRGRAGALVRPASAQQVAEVLRVCRDAGTHVTVQGGRTSLVAGTVPEHDDVLLSTERLNFVGDADTLERRLEAGAGATLARVQRAATAAKHPPKPFPDDAPTAVVSKEMDKAWCSGWTWPRGTRRPSAAWRRRTPAACAPFATGTWASR
ncbi:oxidoreductase [Mycobacterium bohemicum DSM 44277]|uniref:Oxidoreductase n=1 Tax=Mycobacterium bohemicum DSM 44277 TaxID=1236609 RepID=A0A0U0WE05_MYCBE|nr:oxidoreductase [Mycobacterium bohemicum DSM 44277]